MPNYYIKLLSTKSLREDAGYETVVIFINSFNRCNYIVTLSRIHDEQNSSIIKARSQQSFVCSDLANNLIRTIFTTLSRGGARNLPTKGPELPTRSLKWPKNAICVHHFAEKICSDRGARCFQQGGQGGCSPLSPSPGVTTDLTSPLKRN